MHSFSLAPPELDGRRAVLLSDLEALVFNYRSMTSLLAALGASPIAVVKANAYGHGALPVAGALYAAGARRFAVATFEEALALYPRLPSAEILVLGWTPPEAAREAAHAGIALTVSSAAAAKAFSRSLRGERLSIHIKLNSGMNRAGFSLLPEDYEATLAAITAISTSPSLRIAGLYSHLAEADGGMTPPTARAVSRFRAAVIALTRCGVKAPAHLSATAGVALGGAFGFPLARLGLSLYGYAPRGLSLPPLRPVGRLLSRITEVRSLPAGERVGYGGIFRTHRRETVGLLALGYADGLPRAAAEGGGRVTVAGRSVPLVGRVSMDTASLLLSGIPRRLATYATVFGDTPTSLYTLADAAGTIPYEILARLGPRIDRKYIYADDNRTSDPL